MDQSKISIAIIDDNKELCNILKDFLSYQDDIVIKGICNDGIDALKLIKEYQPDLILLDMVMPQLDGIGVLENLNNLNLIKLPKIIIISALGNDNIIRKAISLGVDYYVAKPFDSYELLQRIRQMFYSHTPMSETNKQRATLKLQHDYLTASAQSTIEQKTITIINELGIPNHLKGYDFIITSIDLVVNNTKSLPFVIKQIYASIGEKYSTTPTRVERAIRNAIEIAWSRNDTVTFNKILGYKASKNKGRPTNSEFIALFVDKLRLQKTHNLK